MEFDSSDYFAYKKSKMQTELKKQNNEKKISRFNFLVQLFLATFVIMFIVIVVAIMKYSSKMDIEYSKGDLSLNNVDSSSSISGYNTSDCDDEQRKIDKRLVLIQQEENAPSEARIIQNENKKIDDEVIAPEHVESIKKLDKIEKIKAKNAQSENTASKLSEVIDEVKHMASKNQPKPIEVDENVMITSKVLVGRFSSFDEASKMQIEIKSKLASSSPFVRKVGDIYSVQMGSFQDFYTAKTEAQKLKSHGLEVWIYQQ